MAMKAVCVALELLLIHVTVSESEVETHPTHQRLKKAHFVHNKLASVWQPFETLSWYQQVECQPKC